MVVAGGGPHLRGAGRGNGAAQPHVVGQHQTARLPDHVGKGGVGLGQRLGVGVDGVLQTAGAGGDVDIAADTAGAATAARNAAAAGHAGALFRAAQLADDGRDGDAQRHGCTRHDDAHRDAENGCVQGRRDGGHHALKGRADGADHASDTRVDGREAGKQPALQALADGRGRVAQGALESGENASEGAAQLGRLLPHVAEAVGQSVADLGADVPRLGGDLLLVLAQHAVDLAHEPEGVVLDLLLLIGGQAAVDGLCHPFANAQPVLILDGAVQVVKGAQHALVGFFLQLFPQSVQRVRCRFFNLLGHLFGAVGRDGFDPLHRHEDPVHHVVVGLGDDLFLGLGAVGERLGDGLGGGLDAVHQRVKGRGDRFCRLADGLHGLLDGLLALLVDLGDRLDVLQDTAHQLAGSLGDGLFLLHRAAGHLLRHSFHCAGDLALQLCRAVGDGRDYGLSSVFYLTVTFGQTLGQTGADVYTNLGEHLGRRVDTQQALDRGDHAVDLFLHRRDQIVPPAKDTVLDALNDVDTDAAPVVHAAIPDAEQLGNTGEGRFGQIFGPANNAVHQSGQHGTGALEDFGQVRDKGCHKTGDQHGGGGDQLGQIVGDADDEALH